MQSNGPARLPSPSARLPRHGAEAGFTLIESLMAISILAIVAVQILNVQSSSISVTQNSRDNMRATWAMRSAVSQMEYALDALGPKGLPKDATFPWALDPAFSVNVKVEDTPLEASRLLFTAMKMGNAAGAAKAAQGGDDEKDPAGELKQIGELLDSQIPKDMYRTAAITVSWKEGDTTRSLDGGMLIIDQSVLAQMGKLPNIPGLGGGGEGGDSGDGENGGNGAGQGGNGAGQGNGANGKGGGGAR